MRKNNFNSRLIALLHEKPVVFNPALARLCGSAIGGLFLSQLLYWWDKKRDSYWLYKTISDVEIETTLSRSEQVRAIREWKRLGVLKVEVRGLPPRRHFNINTHLLGSLLQVGKTPRSSTNSSAKSDKLSCGAEQNSTESTQESTQEKRNREIFEAGRRKLMRNFSVP